MSNLLHSHHPRKHLNSFKYAFWGLKHAFLNEGNFRVQVIFTLFVALLGYYFKLSTTQWIFEIFACGILLSSELLNTVIEEFIDHLIHEHHEGVKIIKDLCAGYVLVSAIVCLIVTILVFLPYLL